MCVRCCAVPGWTPSRSPPGPTSTPATQEAVEAQPVTAEDEHDPGRPGTVARVVRGGWRRGDRVLRPVEVVVWTR